MEGRWGGPGSLGERRGSFGPEPGEGLPSAPGSGPDAAPCLRQRGRCWTAASRLGARADGRTDGAAMRTVIAARLCLGLLLLALLIPAQVYSQNGTVAPSSNSTTTSTTVSVVTKQSHNKTATTTKGSGNSLQATASVFLLSLSLLHLYY
ncbi:signal transducer CD24 [Macrotis lagotis]|uniref:signal transducer CD24 n=1 Tax=Macrotis lagotis TaxID=92651 RepID=UPI003D6974A4